jgi:C-methyltransferase C-terminal domain/Putative zinc binding domain/Methyltransferase domain
MNCRHCGAPLQLTMLDLGHAPPSNAFLDERQLHAPETWYPLRVLVCEQCWLAQTQDTGVDTALFGDDYVYFSAYSQSWLEHARTYVQAMVQRFALGPHSQVVEVAANDGYLLQYVRQAGIPCYGVEPTAGTAAAARANNVLAHVPDINDFVAGFTCLLKPLGVVSFEFPHLLRMVQECQFDTAYHEHYSYLSLTAVHRVLAAHGLQVFDVEQWPTHGGSLRVFAQRADVSAQPVRASVGAMLAQEQQAGVCTAAFYRQFQHETERIKNELLTWLLDCRRQQVSVAAYGAAAKGNTLLNFAGVRPDLLPYVVDRNPAKQGKYLPGSRIPVLDEQTLRERKPMRVLILPWNLQQEIMQQLHYIGQWGGQFVSAVPRLRQWAAGDRP